MIMKLVVGESAGLTWPRSRRNRAAAELAEFAIAAGNVRLSASGAVTAETAPRTGRSVRDKFIVRDETTTDRVAWGGFNTPIDSETAGRLQDRVAAYLRDRQTFIVDAWAGADPSYRLGVRVVAEHAWHALFARQLFLRTTPEEQQDFLPGFTVLVAPEFVCNPGRDGVNSEAAIVMDFGRRTVTIAGTRYAGEIKKSVFSYLNYVLPARGVLPMHCSVNVGESGDAAVFFGLSGTGKTTLSADRARRLVGDDEHGWSSVGVFNFEGGCYAKCVNLKRESEPQIFDAIQFGAVLENVVLDAGTREPRFDDISITENTRVAYPVDFIQGAVAEGRAGHPKTVILLSADAFGVLPPVAILDINQALYYFLSGYTAKLAGTEAGMGAEPEATFSACFGAPFLALPPTVFASMLRDNVTRYGTQCYLLNTGWTGGPFGVGERFSLTYTRAMVHAALSGALAQAPVWTDPVFGLHVPESVPGVPSTVLRPRNTWADGAAYDASARALAARFRQNFEQFWDVEEVVRAAGPRG
jgi:phosphoenolpyruvate carboxykinase (ATP)